MSEFQLAVKLFGTAEASAPPRSLRAGRLSALLDAGNLRDIRFDGVEVIRGVSFLLRDVEWGTASIEISGLKIEESADRFTVAYRATCNGNSGFVYDMRVEGVASGQLSVHAQGASERDFLTNRVGFVVLHPLRGVAGRPMTIEHTDGSVETVTMPELISPDQPAFAIRALSHEPADGLHATCRLEGDTFEMEDQRNWTDASFKTYVRPVALPKPFLVQAGERVIQSVTVTISGQARAVPHRANAGQIRLGEPEGIMPAIGLGMDIAAEIDADRAALLARLAPQRLVARLDLRDTIAGPALGRLEALRDRLGAKLTLELVLPARDPEAEIAVAAKAVAASGLTVDAVLPTGAYDLKMRPSNSMPVDAASPADLIQAARRAFPHAMIGGGVLTGFPEFNRNPPPREADFVTHTTSAIVHAADDRSVMETIEALPYVFASAKGPRRQSPLPYRAVRHRHADQSCRIVDRRQSAWPPRCDGQQRPAPGRPVCGGLDPCLYRRSSARRCC